jgi:hypothetical protein
VEEVVFGNRESRNPDKRRKNLEHWIMGNQDRRSGISGHRGFRFREKGRGPLHKSPTREIPTRSKVGPQVAVEGHISEEFKGGARDR